MIKYTYYPIAGRLVVKPIEEANPSSLIIPDSSKEKPQHGVVISSASECIAKPGNTVLYKKGVGMSLPGTDGYLIMKEGVDTVAIAEVSLVAH